METERRTRNERIDDIRVVLQNLHLVHPFNRASRFSDAARELMEIVADDPGKILAAFSAFTLAASSVGMKTETFIRIISDAATSAGVRIVPRERTRPGARCDDVQAALAGLLKTAAESATGVIGMQFADELYGKGLDRSRYISNPRYAAHVAVGHLHDSAKALAVAKANRDNPESHERHVRKAEDAAAYFLVAIVELFIGLHHLDIGAGLDRIIPRSTVVGASPAPAPGAPPEAPTPEHADTAPDTVVTGSPAVVGVDLADGDDATASVILADNEVS